MFSPIYIIVGYNNIWFEILDQGIMKGVGIS